MIFRVSTTSRPRHSKLLTEEELGFNIIFRSIESFFIYFNIIYMQRRDSATNKSVKELKRLWKIEFVIYPVNNISTSQREKTFQQNKLDILQLYAFLIRRKPTGD